MGVLFLIKNRYAHLWQIDGIPLFKSVFVKTFLTISNYKLGNDLIFISIVKPKIACIYKKKWEHVLLTTNTLILFEYNMNMFGDSQLDVILFHFNASYQFCENQVLTDDDDRQFKFFQDSMLS